MEDTDRKRIQRAINSDSRLKRLYHKHESLETKLSTFEHRSFLTAAEEVELKRLKKQKLSGVDQMMQLLEEQPA